MFWHPQLAEPLEIIVTAQALHKASPYVWIRCETLCLEHYLTYYVQPEGAVDALSITTFEANPITLLGAVGRQDLQDTAIWLTAQLEAAHERLHSSA